MYINVILERSEFLLPNAHAPEQHCAPTASMTVKDTGILTAWDGLRIGYFWGGNNETLLRINASDLSTVCHVPTMQQPQACDVPCALLSNSRGLNSTHRYIRAQGSLPHASTLGYLASYLAPNSSDIFAALSKRHGCI